MTNISTGASTVVGGQTSVAVSYDLGGATRAHHIDAGPRVA